MADVHHDDEFRVDQTTPQGSQLDAVEHGHEDRDANVGGIMKWLIGTGILAAVSLALVVGIFKVLDRVTDSPVKPSPMFQEAKLPPAPYIEGLVVKGERAGMTEHLVRVRQRESQQLAGWKMGESDVHNWSVPLKDSDAAGIAGAPKGDATATDRSFYEGQLSDSSGGLKPTLRRQ